ncbi:MAG TPA: methyltransferase [Usitatibacter sp.]|nr:methyltransferase [Usitatibacter sp.]
MANDSVITPESILRIGAGFMAAKHLFVASDIGLFAALAEKPLTLAALATALGLPARTARISADACVSLGLVRREGDRYANAPDAQAFLTGRGPMDLRPWARFWNRISYPAWQGLEEALRGGARTSVHHAMTPEEAEIFSKGVEGFTRGAANAFADVYDLARHRKVLDVAGGTGSFLGHILAKHPRLTATLFEIPSTAAVARRALAGNPAVVVAEGDALVDRLPEGHDLALVANFVHYFGPEKNKTLLRNIRRAIAPRGRIALVDLWTDATHTQPPLAALMAGEFAVLQPEGDVYSVDECKAWLEETGWKLVDTKPLAGPQSVVVGEAV